MNMGTGIAYCMGTHCWAVISYNPISRITLVDSYFQSYPSFHNSNAFNDRVRVKVSDRSMLKFVDLWRWHQRLPYWRITLFANEMPQKKFETRS